VPTEPVTYTWKNIQVTLDIDQGSCFKKGQTIRKTILDDGNDNS